MNDSKFQPGGAPGPQGLQGDVIISPDTLRENRIPPRQARTRKWPVLDASVLDKWKFQIKGLVDTPVTWTWQEFQVLPRVRVFSDFHCVTRWSRLGNLWEGVRTKELLKHVRLSPQTRFVLASGHDWGWAFGCSSALCVEERQMGVGN